MNSIKIYLVGGAVRDQLLGLPISERDYVVVGATASQMLAMGYQKVGKDFPVFLHPKTHEEYALARTERKTGIGYYGFSCAFNADTTLEEDLKRRDLTINAMAQDENGHLIDPYGGMQDLENRILRHVSSAFFEDPLRVLRIARFQAKLPNFHIHNTTYELLIKMVQSPDFPSLGKERMYAELQKALVTSAPWLFFDVLQRIGGLDWFLPQANLHRAKTQLEKAIILNQSQRFFALTYGQTPESLAALRKLPLSRLEQYLLKIQIPLQNLLQDPTKNNWIRCIEAMDALRKREWSACALKAIDTLFQTNYLSSITSLWSIWDELVFPEHLKNQQGSTIQAFYKNELSNIVKKTFNPG